MKKIILIGRVAAGKTTLTQALRGEEIHYFKTQYVNYLDTIIDTPGEYTELRQTSGALALYSYEADVRQRTVFDFFALHYKPRQPRGGRYRVGDRQTRRKRGTGVEMAEACGL